MTTEKGFGMTRKIENCKKNRSGFFDYPGHLSYIVDFQLKVVGKGEQ